ncbi:FAD-binding domain-containing protein [Trichodelitschia bisporula]|uniref:FAD-binding domain-containing protein n=1 Tax=Trichodelitschia bisporula TaxID=703511 RepID=A0A6G1HWK3_9PEZI|nr:FAD-binding domain-containing protein [Trichodelitschia bisporula]
MKYAFFSLLAAAQLATCVPQAKNPAPAQCKKLPGDADWPEDTVWKAALRGVEPRGPQKAWKRPDYKYEAMTVAQVQKAVKFVSDHNLRLSVLNSGHDFIGRNEAPSGLSLVINELKGIRVLDSFTPTPQGALAVNYSTKANTIAPVAGQQAAATLGGGVNVDELNAALRPSGLYSIGAAHGSVSVAGGWSQAGGHAALSSYYGLGSDQILEYKVVTADGALLVANRVSNPDLFWALRGGGGGTFGVVVEATIKVYPAPKILSYNFWLNTTAYANTSAIYPATAYLCAQLPRLNKEGFQGYFYVRPNALQANFLTPNEFANATRMRELMDPILDHMKAMPGINPASLLKIPPVALGSAALGGLQNADGGGAAPPRISSSATSSAASVAASATSSAVASGMAAGHAGMTGMSGHAGMLVRRHGPGEMEPTPKGIIDEDSRLLGEAELTHPRLAWALEQAMPKLPNAQLRSHLVGGGKVFAPPEENASNPAWRRAYVHMMTTGVGTVDASALREISPGMGAYVNEASAKNPDFKSAFWGSHYPKLSAIKKKFDPNFVFYANPGIDADLMVAREGRLCRVGGEIKAQVTRDGSPPDSDNTNAGGHEGEVTSWPLLWQGPGLPPKVVGTPKMPGMPKMPAKGSAVPAAGPAAKGIAAPAPAPAVKGTAAPALAPAAKGTAVPAAKSPSV